MILDGALYPGMSRGGFGYTQQVPLDGYKVDAYSATSDGTLLLPPDIAERELLAAQSMYETFAANAGDGLNFVTAMAFESLASAEVVDDLGCWAPTYEMSSEEYGQILWDIATHESGKVLNPLTDSAVEDLQVCDTPGCLCPRHFDYTFGIVQRDQMLVPNAEHYYELSDGTIQTAWGDHLPSLETSIANLREMQQLCPPYADPLTSPLTANGISKITLEPDTGCWTTRSYYTRPLTTKMYQMDGYGRLTLRRNLADQYALKPGQMMAHRVMWLASGRELEPGQELNHMCGFKPCCNYDHLEQITHGENVQHGADMHRAIAKLAGLPYYEQLGLGDVGGEAGFEL